jgi:hypothetical protein
MIKDFESIKKQLQELAGVINGFKSEAVQLKVIELLFQRMGIKPEDLLKPGGEEGGKGSKRRKKKASSGAAKKEKQPRVSKGNRPGYGAMVKQLIADGFFKKPKAIPDIIDHCQLKMAYTYTTSEMSVALTRAVRNGMLEREKNAQGQYEYKRKSDA